MPETGQSQQGRDTIVIGTSSGGLDALRRLVQNPPNDLPAAVFIVMHVGIRSHLTEILGKISSLPVHLAEGGRRSIKRCGGRAVVQDPDDAAVPFMPRSALCHVDVDFVRPAGQLGQLLDRLSREPAGATREIPSDIRLEATISAQELSTMAVQEKLGDLSPLTCPECNGALWEINDGSMLRYRCHVGHAVAAEAILSARAAEVDKMLETLLRTHRERAVLVRRLAKKERSL